VLSHFLNYNFSISHMRTRCSMDLCSYRQNFKYGWLTQRWQVLVANDTSQTYKEYPVILQVGGSPGTQLVTNSVRRNRNDRRIQAHFEKISSAWVSTLTLQVRVASLQWLMDMGLVDEVSSFLKLDKRVYRLTKRNRKRVSNTSVQAAWKVWSSGAVSCNHLSTITQGSL